eukprot:6213060-Pleurochrysis_carterae.AAC.1
MAERRRSPWGWLHGWAPIVATSLVAILRDLGEGFVSLQGPRCKWEVDAEAIALARLIVVLVRKRRTNKIKENTDAIMSTAYAEMMRYLHFSHAFPQKLTRAHASVVRARSHSSLSLALSVV